MLEVLAPRFTEAERLATAKRSDGSLIRSFATIVGFHNAHSHGSISSLTRLSSADVHAEGAGTTHRL